MLGWEHRKSNALKQHFATDVPDKIWVSDVTCYKMKENYYYICVFIDLFSRKILALSIGRNNSTSLVRTAFDLAYAERKPTSLTIHTDRGTPYTSYTMRNLARKRNIIQSFSHPDRPHDNAVMESFFASLKREELYRVRYKSEPDFRSSLYRYVHFYNSIRPHRHLGYKTPDQYEAIFCNNPKITDGHSVFS